MKVHENRSGLSLGLVLLWVFLLATPAKAGSDNASFPLRITAYAALEDYDKGLSVDWQPFDHFSFGYIYNFPVRSTRTLANEVKVYEVRYWPFALKVPVYVGFGLMNTGWYNESYTVSSDFLDDGTGTVTPGNYTATVTVKPNVAPSLGAGALAVESLWGFDFVFWGGVSQSMAPLNGEFTFTSDNPESTSKDLDRLQPKGEKYLKNRVEASQRVLSVLGVGFAF